MSRRKHRLRKPQPQPATTSAVVYQIGGVIQPGTTAIENLGGLADGAADLLIMCNFHRLTEPERWAFMDRAWQVIKEGGEIRLVVPYWTSESAFGDPRAVWPPFAEHSFFRYSAKWRKDSGNTDLPMTCNFGMLTPDGQLTLHYGHEGDIWITPKPPENVPKEHAGNFCNADLVGRNEEYVTKFIETAKRHNVNAIHTLIITLRRLPPYVEPANDPEPAALEDLF